MGMTVWAEKELTSPSSTNNRHQRLRSFCIGLNMFSLAYVQALYKLVSLQNRLDPCLHAVGEGDTELGWIQESRFVSTLVKLRHEAFVLCSLLQKATALVFLESDLVHLVWQIISSASLASEQVLTRDLVTNHLSSLKHMKKKHAKALLAAYEETFFWDPLI